MKARVLRLNASSDRIGDGIEAYTTRVVPALREQRGYGGARLLIDRESNSAMSVTFWEDDEAARASFDALDDIRTETTERFGAPSPQTELYDAAVQHRPQPTERGNWVRLSTLQGDPGKVDEGIRHFESTVVPQFAEMQGFRGAVLLVNRESGKAIGVTIWNAREDLDASAGGATSIRASASGVFGASSPTVEVFEVAFAELAVPAHS